MKKTTQIAEKRGAGDETLGQRMALFVTPIDARFEDLRTEGWQLKVLRDFSAGLIVAMMAIPLAMGFAMASGLKPEQGIVGGAIAGLVGALFGGSKYQVYGPTAAFIPVIAGLMGAYTAKYDFATAHGMLVLCSILAGVILISLGVAGLGKLANHVPHSLIVGFTIGIAVTIASSQVSEVFGIKMPSGHLGFIEKMRIIGQHLGDINGNALLLAVVTFLITHFLLKISIYIPAPLIAIGCGILLCGVIAGGDTVTLVKTKYGQIPTDFFQFTPPKLPAASAEVFGDIAYFVAVIAFVSGVESLLCSRMADRLADNRGTPFNPNKEFWGQGWVQILVPLLNGFPHTGALARTATNIKVGAITPLAGIFKCVLKLLLAYFLASYLEIVPMACIGGILMWVAFNMVKPTEIKQVIAHNWFHVMLMIVTAVMVIITDFLTGVLSGMVLYLLLFKFLDKPREHEPVKSELAAGDTEREEEDTAKPVGAAS